MQIKQGSFCPLLKKDCVGLQCAWLTQVRGTNPNTGQEVDEWACAMAWLPVLLIENSQQQRQTGAAVESFRNEVVKGREINRVIGSLKPNDNLILLEGIADEQVYDYTRG